jgi:hypothetical protein
MSIGEEGKLRIADGERDYIVVLHLVRVRVELSECVISAPLVSA